MTYLVAVLIPRLTNNPRFLQQGYIKTFIIESPTYYGKRCLSMVDIRLLDLYAPLWLIEGAVRSTLLPSSTSIEEAVSGICDNLRGLLPLGQNCCLLCPWRRFSFGRPALWSPFWPCHFASSATFWSFFGSVLPCYSPFLMFHYGDISSFWSLVYDPSCTEMAQVWPFSIGVGVRIFQKLTLRVFLLTLGLLGTLRHLAYFHPRLLCTLYNCTYPWFWVVDVLSSLAGCTLPGPKRGHHILQPLWTKTVWTTYDPPMGILCRHLWRILWHLFAASFP